MFMCIFLQCEPSYWLESNIEIYGHTVLPEFFKHIQFIT